MLVRVTTLAAAAIVMGGCTDSATTCRWPADIPAATDGGMLGCTASRSVELCYGSPGSSAQCGNLCSSSEYGLYCLGATPDPSLHCKQLSLPGPAHYCCPCLH